MRYKDQRAIEKGYKRKAERYEKALRHIMLAAQVGMDIATEANHWDEKDGFEIIIDKCEKTLSEALDKD